MRVQLRFQNIETQELSDVIEQGVIGNGPMDIMKWMNEALQRHPLPENHTPITVNENSEHFVDTN